MKELLVISALGSDRPGIISQLTRAIKQHSANIQDTRMTVLGGEFALVMLVAGDADAIAALETDLPGTGSELGLTLLVKRTAQRVHETASRPYNVSVVALDNPGIVHEIAAFFHERGINIEEMHTSTYAAAHTGTAMFGLDLVANVPADQAIGRLKEAFLRFCDDRNLDASIEPHA